MINSELLTEKERKDLDAELDFLINRAYGMNLGAVWCQIGYEDNFSKRKAAFLYALGKLIEKGVMKVGRAGKIIEGGKDEICEKFEKNWPSENDFDDDEFVTVRPYKINEQWHSHYWGPGDAVWVNDVGDELWSSDAEI